MGSGLKGRAGLQLPGILMQWIPPSLSSVRDSADVQSLELELVVVACWFFEFKDDCDITD